MLVDAYEQLAYIRRERKKWITSVVIPALEQPGGPREFFLPSEFSLKGNSVKLIGTEVFSKWDLPQLRIENEAFESKSQGSVEQQVREGIVREVSKAIVFSIKESQTWLSTFNTAERINNNTVRWTVSLTGCSQERAKVKRVIYTLHKSYIPPTNVYTVERENEDDNFAFTATGWGKFAVKIRVVFNDGSEKQLEHWLQW